MAIETYTISTDTANGVVDCSSLQREIVDDPTIVTTLNWVTADVGLDLLSIDFVSALSAPEQAALTAVVAAHTGVPTFDPQEPSASAAGVTLISGSNVYRYSTISDAIEAATSGDVILVGPGTYTESFTIPTGVVIQGAYGGGTTIIAGSGATGTRVTLGDGSTLQSVLVLLPTDSVAAVHFLGGIGQRANISNLALLGQGALGIGILQSGSGAMVVERVEYYGGTCDAVFEVTDGQLLLSQVLLSGGTVEDFIRVDTSGVLIADNINVGFPPTVTDCLQVGDGQVVASNLNFQSGTNGLHITSNLASIQIRSSRFDTDTYDILVDGSLTTGTLHVLGTELSERKVSIPGAWAAEANLSLTFQDDSDPAFGDTNLSVWGEFHVGHPEKGSEAAFGRGDGYTRGMVVLTTDATASPSSDGGGFINVTPEASSKTGSTFTFQGTSAGHSILVATTLSDASDLLKIFGWRSAQTVAGVGGSYVFEIWNGSAWVEVGVHATSEVEFYSYSNDVFMRADSSEHLRLGITSATTWASKTINSITAYWARVRITSVVTTLPVFEHIRISPSRAEFNADGKAAFFGHSLYRATLFSAGNVYGESGGVTDVSVNVGAGGLPTGWAHTVKNSLMNSNGDAIQFQFALPRGICTAYPLRCVIYYHTDTNTTVQMILSLLGKEVSGVPVADPSGGIVPVPRTDGNTPTLTSTAGSADTFNLPVTSTDKLHRVTRNGFSIANFYEGDMILLRLELDDDGPGNANIDVFAIELSGVMWTLGEEI